MTNDPYGPLTLVDDARSGSPYHIQPKDIDLRLPTTFGKSEVERTARRLIEFFVMKGRWTSFTLHELTEFYKLKGWEPKGMFFGLIGLWLDDGSFSTTIRVSWPCILITEEDEYFVTNHFIDRCAGRFRQAA